MLDKLKQIYLFLPTSVSKLIVKSLNLNPYSSCKIWNEMREIDKNFSNIELAKKNLKNLKTIMKKNLFYSKNKKYEEFEKLEELPFIDSDILRKEFEYIINKKEKGYFTSTGGTGRNPSKLYLANNSYTKDIAHVLWNWNKLGYEKNEKKLTLRGTNLNKKLFKYNPIYNELQINIFLMNSDNIDIILSEIERFKPTFGHGYPSAFVRLGILLKDKKKDFQLKAISLVSEGFNEEQRKIIEKTFNCIARSFYGHSERAGFASEKLKEKGNYEVALTYGIIEIINKDNKVAAIGEEGEIVCTGFINAGMPLVRYKTGDYATVNKIQGGYITEIKNIKGRWGKDYVYDVDNNLIPTTAINIHSKIQYEFKYIQLYQEIKGEIEIRLVPWDNKNLNDQKIEKLKKEFQDKLKKIKIEIKIIQEKEIYKSNRGKVPYLISAIEEEK